MFSVLSQRKIVILANFNLSSANAFNLVMCKNLSFGKGIIDFLQVNVKAVISKEMTWRRRQVLFTKKNVSILITIQCLASSNFLSTVDN